ncbi:T9SS type B sorting domain-containing protein [Taibaiella helva]|uniref:T9SS type B sorting domain-containing protein n=1 Tax=Taibaiella helva TaxID=2301235 RepID=UPI000E571970|nr:gliding motility-associated C-terminal domain-containing protein [Taibaiella helva]
MSKRLLLLASSLLFLLVSLGKVQAQTDPNLFKLPDTVCNGHEIVPFNIIQTASNYFWTFCPPDLSGTPTGNNIGPVLSMNNTKGIIVAEDDSANYTFHINAASGVVRMKYAEGLNGTPSMITGINNNLANPGGLYLANNGRWHLFVVAGTDSSNSRLVRYDFNENGLKSMPTEVNLGGLGGGLNGPKHLFMAKQGDNWFAFTFTKKDELIRLAFGNDLANTPTLENLGNIDGHFANVTAVTGLVELDNWHLLITNRTTNSVNRISFGNSLTNTPFVVDLGNMGNRINAPVGIAVTRDCNAYYAFVVNYGTASLVTLKWDDVSIANPPTAVNHGNVSGFAQPLCMTGVARDNGALYLLSTNADNSVSKVIFNSCNIATPAYSDLRLPPSFKIAEPGLHTVFLTIDEGLPTVRTDCEQVYVYAHPPLTISRDTMICQGDTVQLSALSFGADSFKWAPDYRIDTLSGQFVKVNPVMTTEYTVTTYYDFNCIVKNPINVKVSKIVADAGPDRTIGDGSSTILGGSGTTIGTQYTYEWTPDIGFTGSRFNPVTTARPPYDITYYLNITNTDGCKAIDSVQVTMPCDDIHLPNAFKPASSYGTGRFGLLNQQFVKINYFKIYDRWGKEVFTTTDAQGKWDGTVDGKEAPLGVYVWEVDAVCANTQERYRRSGTVTLIR